jgi:hypothetical protein
LSVAVHTLNEHVGLCLRGLGKAADHSHNVRNVDSQNIPDVALLMAFVQYLFAGMQHVFQPLLIDQTTSLVMAESSCQHHLEQELWSCTTCVRAISIAHGLDAGLLDGKKRQEICEIA